MSETEVESLNLEVSNLTLNPREYHQRSKNYRIKNEQWYCKECDIYCNGTLQYEMHLVSQKHKTFGLLDDTTNSSENSNSNNESGNVSNASVDENSMETKKEEETNKINKSFAARYTKTSYSAIEINQNLIANKFKVNAEKYYIPENKKNGKFEKFGFYCSTCNAYMTGQIQLIMHVKGAKHQFYFPDEIPGYKSSKVFNPSQHSSRKCNFSGVERRDSRSHSLGQTQMDSISNASFSRRFFDKSQAKLANSYMNGSYNEYLIKNEELMHSHNRFFQVQNGIYHPTQGYNQLVFNSPNPNFPAAPAHIFNRQPIVSFSQTSAPFIPNGFTTPPPAPIHPTLTHHSFQILASSSPISLNNTSNNIILNQNVLTSNRFKMRPNQGQNGESIGMIKAQNGKNIGNGNVSSENSFAYEANPQFFYNQNQTYQVQQSPQFMNGLQQQPQQQQQHDIQQIQQSVHPSHLGQSQLYYNPQSNGATSPNISQTSQMNQPNMSHNMVDDSMYSTNGNQSSLSISNSSSTNPQVNQGASYMHAMY